MSADGPEQRMAEMEEAQWQLDAMTRREEHAADHVELREYRTTKPAPLELRTEELQAIHRRIIALGRVALSLMSSPGLRTDEYELCEKVWALAYRLETVFEQSCRPGGARC